MAVLIDDSRIVNPIFWSLQHLSTVAVALPLINDFDIDTLDKAFMEIQEGFPIQSGNSTELDEDREISCDRAKEKLLFIPSHLRKAVFETAHGMQLEFEAWEYQHPRIICKYKKEGKRFFHWRSNGKINTIQIAQHVVLDQTINIKERFEIACRYGLENNVRNLWSEMKESEKVLCSKASNHPMVQFWVKWLREGCLMPWTDAAVEYLDIPLWYSRTTRFSAFFPLLKPENRRKFFVPLLMALPEDFRLCVYAMDNEEQEDLARGCSLNFLYKFLDWPLLPFFLEVVEKLWDILEADSFCHLLYYIADLESRKEFDYVNLFQELWERSPNDFKEAARRDRKLMRKIDSSCKLKRI